MRTQPLVATVLAEGVWRKGLKGAVLCIYYRMEEVYEVYTSQMSHSCSQLTKTSHSTYPLMMYS